MGAQMGGTATEEKDWRHEAGQKGTDTEQHKKISNFVAYVDYKPHEASLSGMFCFNLFNHS